ncbi:MAG: DUF3418 domain-containing protein, partial [Thiotrichaceae bacterium]|nr:DUF3418 domain-containing protein [Thiotrichaceae bacterium]
AWSKVSLYGLVINAKKKVNYGAIDPPLAQEVFVRDALVTGEYLDKNRNTPRFIKYNLALIQELENLEHKSRRQDLLVDDLAIFEFYQQKVARHTQQAIYSRAAFEVWRKEVEKNDAEYLYLQQSDLLKKDIDHVSDDLYPPHISSGDLQLPLEYHFLPGHALDGVTVIVPLALINQLDEKVFDWLVPGLIREKITLILRSLPKIIRKQFVPVPNTVTRFLEDVVYAEGDLLEQLFTFLKSGLSFTLQNTFEHELQLGDDIDSGQSQYQQRQRQRFKQNMPDHLKMNFKIIDNQAQELDSSRSLPELKDKWASKALQQIDEVIEESIERQDIERWDFERLTTQMEVVRHGMKIILYPALQDKSEKVAIKLFDKPELAQENHIRGVLRLLKLALSADLKGLKKQLPDINTACLLYTPYGSCNDLKKDMLDAILINSIASIIDNALLQHNGEGITTLSNIREEKVFQQLLVLVKSELKQNMYEVAQASLNILQANQQLSKKLKANIPFNLVNTLADIKQQQSHLIYKGFLAQTPLLWLKRMPRYLKGMETRLAKAQQDFRRDALNQGQIIPLWDKLWQAINSCKNKDLLIFIKPPLVEYRWLLEEFRISLFAQELKTVQAVSAKRLEKKWLLLD